MSSINLAGFNEYPPVSKVTPFLNKQEGVESWEVDTANPDKILTIESDGASEEDVKATLQKVGFKAEPVD